ncbi:hypothetical protein MLD38_000102 [Melastoma candidum]|uniref:Uncharacterized protein n=1 Tax=Melastoma candidum TaxID=119954 RepID=A0ACB9S951_9MYRT|nr:hypothetical protein MLD38_000102 [Melastoma candidum]
MDNRNVVVCDNGTGYVKCGFAGENFPTSVFPCVVGRPMLRYEESLTEQEIKDIVVGEACASLRNQLNISYPVNNGIVQNWDDMGHVWDHAFFNELKVNPPDCKILLTDPPLNPSKNREKMKFDLTATGRDEGDDPERSPKETTLLMKETKVTEKELEQAQTVAMTKWWERLGGKRGSRLVRTILLH